MTQFCQHVRYSVSDPLQLRASDVRAATRPTQDRRTFVVNQK